MQTLPARFRTPCAAALALLLGAAPLAAQRKADTDSGSSDSRSGTTLLERMKERHAEGRLLIPVEGILPRQLRDTFRAARSGGREHDAIDIHAPRGTPVVAVTDGSILRFHRGARGGNAIYLLSTDGRTRYYYAHLERYAEGLAQGDRVRRGQTIGYVGDTGNAQPGDYHLHFSIAVLSDLRRWWEGTNVNPFPLLAQDAEARR